MNLLALAISAALHANTPVDKSELEEVTILGQPGNPIETIGAATAIGADELERFKYADIQEVLRQVPGVTVQVEDGYGLRPNISIRGVASERSGRITLLEDNVLIAPAPYSAPSAYYFPTTGRMNAFEILKGPAAITQGPYTIGGALNMVSTPIPNDATGSVLAEAGEDSTFRLHAHYGDQNGGFGYLVETHQWYSDGFQDIDRTGTDTGLDKEDYTAKLRFENNPSGDQLYQWLELKLQRAEEDSNQSYLGLTDADLGADRNRRYGLSALDNIQTEHDQLIARYGIEFNDQTRLVATAYNNEHQRDWFKTEGIDLDGSTSTADFSRTGWFNVVQAVNMGNSLGETSADQLQAILDGADTATGAIELRNNAREYYSRGLQLDLQHQFNAGRTDHDVEMGLRWHEDEEDRLQRFSTYTQVDGQLVLDDLGQLGNAGNRIQQAEALAFHVRDTITFGDWTLSPGFRYEDIEQSRIRYETRGGRTADPASRADDNVRDQRRNDTSVFLPGMGIGYRLSPSINLIAGAHKGFTAPTNSPGVREEEAWNYELGIRYGNGDLSGSVIGFLTDYDNLLGVCTASSGADCEVGDAFNGDAATVAGIEAEMSYTFALANDWTLPMQLSYTYIDGEFDTDIADTNFFGDVAEGDPIPYIPEHRFWGTVGLVNGHWSGHLSLQYVDETCVRASCNAFETTDSAWLVDVSAEYQVNTSWTLYGRVENLGDDDAILGRQPYGARTYRDRTAVVGFRFSF